MRSVVLWWLLVGCADPDPDDTAPVCDTGWPCADAVEAAGAPVRHELHLRWPGR